MTDQGRLLRAVLGLSADTPLERIGEAAFPAVQVGEGKGSDWARAMMLAAVSVLAGIGDAGTVEAPDELVQAVRSAPRFAPMIIPGLTGNIVIRAWTRRPGVYLIEGAGLESVLRGIVVQDGDLLIAAAEDDLVVLRLAGEAGEVVVELRTVGVKVYRLPDAYDQLSGKLAELPLSAFLDGWSCEPDVVQEACQLVASPSVVDRAAAAGLVARLWRPTERAERDAAVQAMIQDGAGADIPPNRALAWVTRLGARERDALEGQALEEAATLREALERCSDVIADDPAAAAPVVLYWMHGRDRLESVARVLRSLGRGDSLDAALAAIDRAAGCHATALSAVGPWPALGHLAEVVARDPDAWWGLLAATRVA